MPQYKTLAEAKRKFKARTGSTYDSSQKHHSGLSIFNRNKEKHRRGKPHLRLSKPYFLGSYIEWLNL